MMQKNSVIHSQLIPVHAGLLLLPNTAIAEIVRYQDPQPLEHAPDWLLGTLEWRGLHIPLVSFERATGEDAPPLSGRNRIAVINAVHSDAQLRFYAILTQGNPRLLNVAQQNMSARETTERAPLLLSAVVIGDTNALIPDMGGLERMLMQAGATSTQIH